MEKYPEIHSIELFVQKLDDIDREIRTPVPVNDTIWSKVFGESQNARRLREKETNKRVELLREQRALVISSFVPPDHPDSLLRLAQMAIASYNAAPSDAERQAWRDKLAQCVQMLDASLMNDSTRITNLDVKLAYVRGELDKIEQKELAIVQFRRREIGISAAAAVVAVGLAPFTDGATIGVAILGLLAYWLWIRRKL